MATIETTPAPPSRLHRSEAPFFGRRSTSFGRALIAIGVVGIIATLVAVFFGLRLVDRTGDTLTRSLSLTADAVETIEETIAVSADSIELAGDGLETLTDSVAGAQQSFVNAGQLLDDTADALATDVPDSIEAIRATMPALIRSAELLDGALGALSFVGVDYAPETPPADSLRNVETGLTEVADRLRAGAGQLDTVGDNFSGLSADAVTLTSTLEDLTTNLERADAVLDGYAATAEETAALVAQAAADLEQQRSEGRFIVLLLGVVLGLGQVVPILLGARFLSSE